MRIYGPYFLRRDIATFHQIAVPIPSVRTSSMNTSLFLAVLFPLLYYGERVFWRICTANERLQTESHKRKRIEDGPNDEESQNIISELENDSCKSFKITCTQLNQKIQEIRENFWRDPRDWFQLAALYILFLWKLTKYEYQSSIHSIDEGEIHLKSVFVTSVPENSFDPYSRLLIHPRSTALWESVADYIQKTWAADWRWRAKQHAESGGTLERCCQGSRRRSYRPAH